MRETSLECRHLRSCGRGQRGRRETGFQSCGESGSGEMAERSCYQNCSSRGDGGEQLCGHLHYSLGLALRAFFSVQVEARQEVGVALVEVGVARHG